MDLPYEKSKILIVDDEEVNVNLLLQVLKHVGYTNLYSTIDPREVCDLYKKNKPDLILLDIRMPYLDGFQVMQQLEQIKGDSYLPILILTAEADDETRLSALGGGGKDFMGKPVNIPELLLRVRNLLEIKLLGDQVRNQNLILEEKVNERTQELQTVNEELTAFNFSASHDFQEPLRKIITFGDRLKIKLPENISDECLHYLDRMQVSAMRLRTLIDDLLNYSNMESCGYDFKGLDLKKTIEEVVDDLEIQIEKSGGTVKVGTLPTIEANASQMRELFQNLISNGLKYCKADEPPIVSVNSRSVENEAWEISVEDNGIGFDEQYSNQIFKPFKRLHEREQYEGTGMGLFLCKKIVSRHSGSISVTSQLQKGTTFTVTLPGTHQA